MTCRTIPIVVKLLLLSGLSLLLLSTVYAADYSVQELQLPPSAIGGWATDINEAGEIVGFAAYSEDYIIDLVIWDSEGKVSLLGVPRGYNSGQVVINDAGQVAGTLSTRAFLWNRNKGYQFINLVWAIGINNKGQVCGMNGRRASVWNPDDTVTDLPYIPTLGYNYAWSINDNGLAVGYTWDSTTGISRAFCWNSDTGMTMLPALGGKSCSAIGVNNSEEIAGTADGDDWYTYGIVWKPDGSYRVLEASPAMYWADVWGINDNGYVVGSVSGNDYWRMPCVWTPDSKYHELCMPTGSLYAEAHRINNKGLIVGYCAYGTFSAPQICKPVLWTPKVYMVAIDIKPGNSENCINLTSKGVLPVAVLSTSGFQAASVDPTTVKLAGAAAVKWHSEDVDGDGDIDLLLHFNTMKLNLEPNAASAVMLGQAFDGVDIQGTDNIKIIKSR